MPKRMAVLASAVLAILVAAVAVPVRWHHAQAAPDNCLAMPNAAPPQGSHWYYRVDEVGNRRCWYLGPEGAKQRQAWSPKLQPAPTPRPKPASQPNAAATAATPAQPVAREPDATATFSMLAPALPTSDHAVDAEPASASDGAARGLAAIHPEDDMPLIWPVLSATDLAAAGPPPMLAYVAAALALVMIVREVFRWFAVRRLRRRRLALREQWNQELWARRAREPVSPAFAGTIVASRPAQSRRKSVVVPRTAEIARPPADDRDPAHGREVIGAEETLQQLLYGRRRVAA